MTLQPFVAQTQAITTSRISPCFILRVLLCSCALAVLPAQQSVAALFTLIDENSSAQFDTSTQANNFDWVVDGSDLLSQQAYWYRIGNNPESAVHQLPIVVQGTSDTNFDGNQDSLFVRYNNGSGLKIETRYSLDGGAAGSHSSDMSAQISITNLTASPMDFHFFQYADFDLTGSDSVVFTNLNTVQQSGPGSRLLQSVATPTPTHHEAALFPLILNKMNDGLATTLSDTPVGTAVGPGDMSWANQWDVVIAPGETFQIVTGTNLNAVPEPSIGWLLVVASGLLFGVRLVQRRAGRVPLPYQAPL